MPPYPRMVLLAFLALTVSFYKDLVQLFPTRQDASEYYYAAAKAELGDVLEEPTIERIQTMLMLGMYEWGMLSGGRAWRTVGAAIRCAHQLALHIDDDKEAERITEKDDATHNASKPMSASAKADQFIRAEIRRRTYWTCFILDRYLTGGKYRPSDIDLTMVRIQLPCSESAFNMGKAVKTSWLAPEVQNAKSNAISESQSMAAKSVIGNCPVSGSSPSDDNGASVPVESVETPQCHYIRAMEFFRHYMAWTTSGGRRLDDEPPPWDERSHVAKFEKELEKLRSKLNDDYAINHHVMSARVVEGTCAAYTLVHALHFLCIIVLHREYIPFSALNCREGPIGPLDEPKFPVTKQSTEYWKQSSQKCFEAARDLSTLLYEFDKRDSFVETPLTIFALHQVAVCGNYLLHYPWMTQVRGFKVTQNWEIFALLQKKTDWMLMARERWKSIMRMHHGLTLIGKQWKDSRRAQESASQTSGDSSDSRTLPIHEGGPGGGLEIYAERHERDHKEFGSIRADIGSEFKSLRNLDKIEGPEQNGDLEEGIAVEEPREIQTQAAAASMPETSQFTPLNTMRLPANATKSGDTVRISDVPNATGYPSRQERFDHTSLPRSAPHPDYAHAPFGEASPTTQQMYYQNHYHTNATESAQRDSLNMQSQQSPLDQAAIFSPPQQTVSWGYPPTDRQVNYADYGEMSLNFGGDIPQFQIGEGDWDPNPNPNPFHFYPSG